MQSAWSIVDELSGTTTQFVNCGKFHWNVTLLRFCGICAFEDISAESFFTNTILEMFFMTTHVACSFCANAAFKRNLGKMGKVNVLEILFCSEILFLMAGHWPMLLSSRKYALLLALTGVACVLLPLLRSWKTRSTSLWVLTFRYLKSTAWARALVRHLFYHLSVLWVRLLC